LWFGYFGEQTACAALLTGTGKLVIVLDKVASAGAVRLTAAVIERATRIMTDNATVLPGTLQLLDY